MYVTVLLFAASVALQDAPVAGTAAGRNPNREPTQSATIRDKLDTRLQAAVLAPDDARSGTGTRRTGRLDIDREGRVLVDIRASVTAVLTTEMTRLGCVVLSAFPAYNSIRARVPLAKLETLAARSDVTFVRAAEQAITNPATSGGRQ